MYCDKLPTPRGCFYELRNPFCEAVDGHYGSVHFSSHGHEGIFEPLNTLSNVFYLFAAYWIWPSLDKTQIMLRLCTCILVALGISSSLYHGTMWFGFQILDQFSMNLFLTFSLLALGLNFSGDFYVYFLGIFYTLYLVFLLALPMEDNYIPAMIPNFAFLVPVILIAITVGISCYRLVHTIPALRPLLIGIVVSFCIAIGFHFLDENECTDVTQYLFPHVFWHGSTAYASLLLLTYIAMVKGKRSLTWYFILPILDMATKKDYFAVPNMNVPLFMNK